MHGFLRSFFLRALLAALVLAAASLWAQEVYHSRNTDLMARLSYDSTAIVHGEDVRQVCIAVARDGDYRMVRMMNTGETERLEGKMTKDQVQQLKKLLATNEFRMLAGDHGGLIRQESESFGAEIPRGDEGGTQRLNWLNADGERPFPDSVVKVVDWLKHFEAESGTPFEYAEYPDVCPAGGLRLLQPSMAQNGRP